MKNEELPFHEQQTQGFLLRTFSQNLTEEELKWHFDDENRMIVPVSGYGWKLQIDECLPEELLVDKEYMIPVDVYHRLIKGNGDLEVRLYKLDSKKGENPKYTRSYDNDKRFSDHLLYHLKNEIPLQNNIFRYGSDAWCDLIQEAKQLFEEGKLELDADEIEFLEENPGKIIHSDGEKIILNTPFRNTEENGHEFYVDVLDKEGKVKRLYFS